MYYNYISIIANLDIGCTAVELPYATNLLFEKSEFSALRKTRVIPPKTIESKGNPAPCITAANVPIPINKKSSGVEYET